MGNRDWSHTHERQDSAGRNLPFAGGRYGGLGTSGSRWMSALVSFLVPAHKVDPLVELVAEGDDDAWLTAAGRRPAGALPDEVAATYTAGILEVTVPVKQEDPTRQIEVKIHK